MLHRASFSAAVGGSAVGVVANAATCRGLVEVMMLSIGKFEDHGWILTAGLTQLAPDSTPAVLPGREGGGRSSGGRRRKGARRGAVSLRGATPEVGWLLRPGSALLAGAEQLAPGQLQRAASSLLTRPEHRACAMSTAQPMQKPRSRTISQCLMGSAINAISRCPDRTLIIAGGRDILKLARVEAGGRLVVHENVRKGKGKNLNSAVQDLKWHPSEQHLIASAATNGAVVVWDLNRMNTSRAMMQFVLTDHERTVNRVSWHPSDASLLLSGSQDSTVKLWDVRRGTCTQTYGSRSEVRDVQFSPHYTNYFAAVLENGVVQLWDIRRGEKPFEKIVAHNGLVLAVDWHPDDRNKLASGGRDKTIKIWNLKDSSRPETVIQTIASVGRLQWRPGFSDCIASSSRLTDYDVHVWDATRPHVPIASFKGHCDETTGFFWGDAGDHRNRLFSCSKDGTLQAHNFEEAHKPCVPTLRCRATVSALTRAAPSHPAGWSRW